MAARCEHTIKLKLHLFSLRQKDVLQLEAIKKERGPSVEDGTVARDKTLAAILAENKAKKEEQFANVWKTMKQGLQLLLLVSDYTIKKERPQVFRQLQLLSRLETFSA